MVDSHFLVSISRSLVHAMASAGARLPDHPQRSRKSAGNLNPAKPTSCHWSLSAAADAAALLAVLLAFGFLLLPCLQMCCRGLARAGSALLPELRDEPLGPLAAFLLLALAFLLLAIAAFAAFLPGAGGRKCGDSGCQRLRDAAGLGVGIEMEENRAKGWISGARGGDGPGRLFLALGEGCQGVLEAELGRMAPPNGGAVLLFRERCGCAVGRRVVAHGPKKTRKAKM